MERDHFFISYTGKDKERAEWIAWQLEKAGYPTTIQAWDFTPGSDFVLKMHDAVERTDRTLLVLSQAYFKSSMTSAEWSAVFSPLLNGDPDSLLPVRIEDFSPPGLLKHRVYVDLVGLDAQQARQVLLAGVKRGRRKPTSEPPFSQPWVQSTRYLPGGPEGSPDKPFHLPTDELPQPSHYLPPGSRMPLKRNPLFVGREEDLLALAEALNAGETAAIGEVQTAAATGAGGIGKTQLAAEFVYRYGQLFPGGVFWMSFADPEGVEAEVASCGLEPSSPLVGGVTSEAFGKMKLDQQVRRIRLVWKEPVPRLLVFDNCEDPDLLEAWRPEVGGCRVLVTSRRQEWGKALGVRRHLLDKLPRPRSLELLLEHRADLEPDPDLEALAEELGDFPLALALAGSYLEVYEGLYPAVGPFLEELHQANPLDHPALKGAFKCSTVRDHDRHVARTFQISLERLNPLDPVDSRALSVFARASWFGLGIPIPPKLLRSSLGRPVDREEERNREEAIRRLVALGLLTLAGEGAFLIHRLVAVLGRHSEDAQEASDAVQRAVLSETRKLNRQGYPRRLLPWQAQFRMVADHSIAEGSDEAPGLCNELGYHLWAIGDLAGARPYYRRALTIREASLGPDHPDTAQSLNDLGHLLWYQGDLSEAHSYFERALTIFEACLGPNHSRTATSLNNLGALLQAQGKPSEARPYYERSLAIREASLGPDHPDTAQSLNNLGFLLQSLGALSRARPYYERSLAIREASLGLDHPDTAQSLNNLGTLLQSQRDLLGARRYYERALAINEASLGPDHPETGRCLNNLGELLHSQGDLAGARQYLKRGLAIREGTLGRDHPDTAQSLNNLGMLLAEEGDREQAWHLVGRALAIEEKVYGTDHPETKITRMNLESLTAAQES